LAEGVSTTSINKQLSPFFFYELPTEKSWIYQIQLPRYFNSSPVCPSHPLKRYYFIPRFSSRGFLLRYWNYKSDPRFAHAELSAVAASTGHYLKGSLKIVIYLWSIRSFDYPSLFSHSPLYNKWSSISASSRHLFWSATCFRFNTAKHLYYPPIFITTISSSIPISTVMIVSGIKLSKLKVSSIRINS
jgi:hypothetical protein